jgi:hypothetical protein
MAFLEGILEAMPDCKDSESYNRVLYTLTGVISNLIAESAIDIEKALGCLRNNLEEAVRTKRRILIESSSH